jgi:hypothetical protein
MVLLIWMKMIRGRMSLMDAWKRWEIEMEKKRIENHYDTQQKMIEAHKAMWGKHDKNNSVNMLTIRNINKIVGKQIYIGGNTLAIAKVEDVYEWTDNRYEFRIKVETPDGKNNLYRLKLNRNKIPYPIVLTDCWELSYEEKPNQLKVEALGKEDLRNMGEVIRRIGNLMDRILK